MFTNWGSAFGVCTTASLYSIPMAIICGSRCWSMAYTRSALSGCSIHFIELGVGPCYSVSCPPAFHQYGGAFSFLESAESSDPSAFPTYLLPPNDMVNLSLWWVLNLVILVWQFGIRLINLLTPLSRAFLLNHTFSMGLQARCQH